MVVYFSSYLKSNRNKGGVFVLSLLRLVRSGCLRLFVLAFPSFVLNLAGVAELILSCVGMSFIFFVSVVWVSSSHM